MKYYSQNIRQVIKDLKTSVNLGLTEKEALKRLEIYGKNEINHSKRKNIVIKFLEQFKDFMVIILIIAALISFFAEIYSGGKNFTDSLVILIIVVFNALMGLIQETKADKAIDALKNMTKPHSIVLRDGEEKEISTSLLTVGDIIILKSGNQVPADCRIIEAVSLLSEESALTGESGSVEKDESVLNENTPLAERKNSLYMGTNIVQGRCKAVVTAIGDKTEMGEIAKMIKFSPVTDTPLQIKLNDLGKYLGVGALLICLIIFGIGVIRHIPVFSMFMESVSLAVAAIPEGLPAVVTVMLAIGVSKMAEKRAIVKSLPSVEALGNTTIICSDKTGTLTENKMTVTNILGNEDTLKLACLCCDADLEKGEPTEMAIVMAAFEKKINKKEVEYEMPRVYEIPFNSSRKLMTTVHIFKKDYLAITKGACENVLELCKISKSKKSEILSQNNDLAKKGLRVIAVAKKECSEIMKKERDMTFLGLIAMEDKPREGVKNSIEICKNAGIRTIMITGDNPLTAKAIGNKIGIVSEALTGNDLDNLHDEEFEKVMESTSIFARVSPRHKLKIVSFFQNKGEVVAMTGDGINDAPALKKADIGCAMGKGGTEVAREASDIVLADDNFNTIVMAIKQGRIIFENIKKSIHFLLSSNIGELIAIFSSVAIGFAPPLVPVQLLWVNLVTDSFPAIALGLDECDDDIMIGKRNSKSFLNKKEGIKIGLEGAMIGMLSLVAYGIGKVLFKDITLGRTMAFCVLSISQLIHAFNMRSEKSLLEIDIMSNPYVIGAFILGTFLQIVVVHTPLCFLFQTTPLSASHWLIVMALSVVPIIVCELEKRCI
ncbi:MAG: cation-translocating P-type ATPase [Lachnospirales bacterium]